MGRELGRTSPHLSLEAGLWQRPLSSPGNVVGTGTADRSPWL